MIFIHAATLKSYKYWSLVAKLKSDDGDKNLFYSCPSLDDYKKKTD